MNIDNTELIDILNAHKGILYKITNVYAQDMEDRKDLEQEIIIQIWKSLPNFKGNSKMSTWIYRVALNVAIAHNRKAKTRSKINQSLDNLIIEPSKDTRKRDDNTKELYRFINQLDKFNKAIVILYLDGYTYDEIANIIGRQKNLRRP